MNLRTLIEERAAESGESTGLIVCEKRLSYGELDRLANQAANMLVDLGVGQGDKVAVILPNCWEFVALWLGVAKLGAVFVPINVYLRGEVLRYLLEHSDANILVVDDSLTAAVDGAGGGHGMRLVRGRDLDERLAAVSTTPPPAVDIAPGDVFSILYTSGTAGRPKGVLLSHNALINSGRELARLVGVGADDTIMTVLPLFHVGAQVVAVMTGLCTGRPVVIAESFSAREYWDTVRRYNCTILHHLGTVLRMLLKQPPRPDDRDNPARKLCGAGVTADIWRAFEERFGVSICEGYGLTESSGIMTVNPSDQIRVGSVGKTVPYAETIIVDEQDRPVPAGVTGEIVMRPHAPHTIMEGYYKDPEATARTLRNGWLHTGDRGRMDEDGYLYFIDRLKDCIRRRGENISSFEVELVINTHPQVLESAAVGVPAELGEEEVKIVVVPQPGEQIDPLTLVQWAEERMAHFMVPRYVEIRDALPKTETQKVQKSVLRGEGIGQSWDREAAGYRLKRR